MELFESRRISTWRVSTSDGSSAITPYTVSPLYAFEKVRKCSFLFDEVTGGSYLFGRQGSHFGCAPVNGNKSKVFDLQSIENERRMTGQDDLSWIGIGTEQADQLSHQTAMNSILGMLD